MNHDFIKQQNYEDDKHQTVTVSQQHLPSAGTRLPMEILAIIFWMVVVSYEVHYDPFHEPWDEQLIDATTVLHASQVCRFWRFAALDCKRLWGMLINIDFCGDRWVEELLRRSNPAPLVIQSVYASHNSHQRFSSPKWTAALNDAHRFQILHIGFHDADDISPLLGILTRPSPLLECFKLQSITEWSTPGYTSVEYDIETPLIAGNAPKLRCLVVKNTLLRPFIDFSSFKLVHLDLSHSALSFGLSISTWLDVLFEQPLLKTLAITDSVFDITNLDLEVVERREVPLLFLESLELKCDIVDGGNVFGNLVLPASCYVYLNLDRQSENNSVDGVVRGLKRCLQNWEGDTNQCGFWKIVTEGGDSFTIQIDTGSVDTDFFFPRFSLQYQFDDEFTEWIPSFPSPFTKLLEFLQRDPFMQRDSVLSLSISGLDAGNLTSSVLSFLSAFKTVSKIVLDGWSMDQSLRQLLQLEPIPPQEEADGDRVGHVLFPGLKYVTLEGPYNDRNAARPRAFYEYLKWRHDMGKAVHHVTICVAAPGEFHSLEPCFSNSLTIGHGTDLPMSCPSACSTCLWTASLET